MHKKTSIYVCSTLWNTRLLRQIGGFHSPHELVQDGFAFVKLAAAHPYLNLEEIKASFRKHANELTFAAKVEHWIDDYRRLRELICELTPEDQPAMRERCNSFFSELSYNRADKLKSWPQWLKAYYRAAATFGFRHLRSPFETPKRLNYWVRRRIIGLPARQIPWLDRVWSIGIYAGDSPFSLSPCANAKNPVLHPKDIPGRQVQLIADPFMVCSGGTWHMFVEVVDPLARKGEIALATSSDEGMNWQYQGVVLSEPHHLSYPFVFEWQGQHYMMPEAFRSKGVQLYRAEEFPTKWKKIQTLLSREILIDGTLFRHNEIWYMFAATREYGDTLHLFYADDLCGPWHEHPANPIVVDNPIEARPAGRVIFWDNRLFRLAQECQPLYGTQVTAFEITQLNQKQYRERSLGDQPVLKGTGKGWNALGMHHMDAHPLPNGRWIACVDGWTSKHRGLRR
jgi:hypothetical protein